MNRQSYLKELKTDEDQAMYFTINRVYEDGRKILRHLGFDPGIKNTAFAEIEQNIETGQLDCVNYGILPMLKGADPLIDLDIQIESRIKNVKPNTVGVESVFFGTNINSAINTSKVIGLIERYTKRNGFIYREVVPTKLKKFITGKGNCNKKTMIKTVFEKMPGLEQRLQAVKKSDLHHIIDAIAVGIWIAKECERVGYIWDNDFKRHEKIGTIKRG